MGLRGLLYHSLVAGLAAGALHQAASVLLNSLAGKPTIVAIRTPFEMYVEYPILFSWSFAVLTWTIYRIIIGIKKREVQNLQTD